ncbi:MAG: hypothetical protein RSD82_02205 [Comamonas sp.]
MAWVLPLAALLGACSSGPSDRDAHAALERHFAAAAAKFGDLAGRDLLPTVQSVVLADCTVPAGGQYLCNAQVSMYSKVLGQRQASTRLLLTQDSKGWRLLSQL